MSNRTILLIDYDPQSIESAIKPLTGAGYNVEVANDGIAGLQAFERLQPDLVLIEPMVPKKHGFEVCQEIKDSDQGKCTPVLITTTIAGCDQNHDGQNSKDYCPAVRLLHIRTP